MTVTTRQPEKKKKARKEKMIEFHKFVYPVIKKYSVALISSMLRFTPFNHFRATILL